MELFNTLVASLPRNDAEWDLEMPPSEVGISKSTGVVASGRLADAPGIAARLRFLAGANSEMPIVYATNF